jgi:GTP cyclohydrolase I
VPRVRRPPKDRKCQLRANRPQLERAVAAFLSAAGLDVRADSNLRSTPKRVADAWYDEFLDGYRTTPKKALGPLHAMPRGTRGDLVVVTNLRFRSMCPHHLLPYEGRAHVAYLSSNRVAGFGRLAALVDCYAHRLILQEALAQQVAASLAEVLGSPATACIVEARQACLSLRGPEQAHAMTHAEAYEGRLRTDRQLRRELWARLPKAPGA